MTASTTWICPVCLERFEIPVQTRTIRRPGAVPIIVVTSHATDYADVAAHRWTHEQEGTP
jgi:hypothetical protein